MLVMNALLDHSDHHSKQKRKGSEGLHVHLGCIVFGFVGLKRMLNKNSFTIGDFHLRADTLYQRKFVELEVGKELAAITTEHDFSYYATLWLHLLEKKSAFLDADTRLAWIALAACAQVTESV